MIKTTNIINKTRGYIIPVSSVICTVLAVGLVGFKITISKAAASAGNQRVVNVKTITASTCGKYIIAGSTTRTLDKAPNGVVSFSLWYDSCSQSNYGSANIVAGSISGLNSCVNRNGGPDGPPTGACHHNCPSTGVCDSPEIYSPNNTSYAWIESDLKVESASF